jgi:formylglycine-generating enzyme required for sulfatase activity
MNCIRDKKVNNKIKLFIHFIVNVVFFCLAQKALASNSCNAIFNIQRAYSEILSSVSPEFQTSLRSLAELHLHIALTKQKNPDSIVAVSLNDAYQKKYQQHLEYFRKNEIMNEDEMKSIMREYILEKQGRLNRDKELENERRIEIESLDPKNRAQKMTFHDLTPGKFKMGDAQIDTEITKPFAMMQTQVTQMMWARLKVAMGEKDLNKINPSNFKTGTDSTTVNIEGIDVQMKPDHPVEHVSYEDIKEFLVGLNKLSNSGDAKDQALLDKLIPGHKKGDVYDLPTEAQWEFTIRDRGNVNKKYFDRDDEVDLPNYAWYFGNSGNETHAVATKQPRMIDGKPFFDMEGNVFEWTKDWQGTLIGGADPEGPTTGFHRVLRGGIRMIGWSLWSDFRQGNNTDFRSTDVGFRLVRTRP